jgi:anti-sigma B factor antagonist
VSIEYTALDGIALMRITGDLDVANADQLTDLGQMALTEVTSTLRIDLTELGFIDSTGLSALHALQDHADQHRYTLILDNPPERVIKLLAISGLTGLFTVSRSREMA